MKICREFEVGKTAYTYRCEACGIEEDLYYHMNEGRPEEYNCPVCKVENSMYRVFDNKQIHIPYQWGTTDNDIKFNKSPSRRKHFF